jgi:hypothetical protein
VAERLAEWIVALPVGHSLVRAAQEGRMAACHNTKAFVSSLYIMVAGRDIAEGETLLAACRKALKVMAPRAY